MNCQGLQILAQGDLYMSKNDNNQGLILSINHPIHVASTNAQMEVAR